MQYTYQDIFSYCSKQFLNSSILMPFSASAVFLFHLFHICKMFPFEGFFSYREIKKKSLRMRLGGEGGWDIGVLLFWVKNCWTLNEVWAGALIYHPSWNGQTHGVLKKNSLKLNTASDNTASWYTDTDGLLEHSPNGGSLYYKEPALQKIIPVLGGPSCTSFYVEKQNKPGLWTLNRMKYNRAEVPQKIYFILFLVEYIH